MILMPTICANPSPTSRLILCAAPIDKHACRAYIGGMMTPHSLKARMDLKGFKTATALAKALGVNQSTVSKWLSGKHPIDEFKAEAIRRLRPRRAKR